MTSLLFVATAVAPFGEAVCGMEIARAAHVAGHRVMFLHTSKVAKVFEGAPFERGIIDDIQRTLLPAVRETVKARDVDAVVLVDVVSTYAAFGAGMRSLVESAGTKVVALDLWSCHETDLVWDMGELDTRLDRIVVELPCVRPCPVARPDAPGAYRAIPELAPLDRAERTRVRAELGLTEDELVVFTADGRWQAPNMWSPGSSMQRLAAAWPYGFELVRRRLGARVIHVGPAAWPLANGYVHLPQVAPAQFQRLIGASDVLIGNNVMATSIATAVALDIPALVIRNTATGVVGELAPDIAAWVGRVQPLRPWAVCPLGLHDFVAPVLAHNPYAGVIDLCDVLDPDVTARRVREALDGDPAARAARAGYRALAAALPTGCERLLQLISDA